MKLRIEPCESYGKHVLELWNGERWVHLLTGYMCEVSKLKENLEEAIRNELALISY